MIAKPTYEELEKRIQELEAEALQQQMVEREHQKVETIYRQLAENIRGILIINSPDKKKTIYVNPEYEKVWGMSCASLYENSKSFLDAIHPQDRERVIETFKQQKKGEKTEVEYRVVRNDGRVTWVNAITRTCYNVLGYPQLSFVNVQDISKRKQVEAELERTNNELEKLVDMRTAELADSDELLRVFMDHNPAAIYIKDENLEHIYANNFMLELFGIEDQDFVGTSSHDFFPTKIANVIEQKDRIVLSKNSMSVREVEATRLEGGPRWFRDIRFPIQLKSGKRLLGGIAVDVTKTKQDSLDLKKAYDEINALKQKLVQENIYLRDEIELSHHHEEIIGNSGPVIEMLSQVEQVAETDATVLILGETGTGKELLANGIHRMSRRKNQTMIKVNCAALPATLIESELFGREKGAYTGSMSRQIGRFEIADGSTLFLDEIGEMPLEVQAKLLRVLQEGQFERLGSPRTLSTDVRIIASTNRDLAKNVAEGNFREDLYYRLNVFPVNVPPLRDRCEDLPMLVWHFVKELEGSMGKTIHQIPKKSLAALQEYKWPGNIRELRNVVENAMIIAKGKTLSIAPPANPNVKVENLLKLEDVERNHIKDILKKTSWRVSGQNGAAELLGLKPTTLESRMKKLGITRPR